MNLLKAKKKEQEPEQTAVIGKKELDRFSAIIQQYKDGKSSVDARVIENEEWWKLHQWQQTGNGNPEDIQPKGAYLWNTIEVKHADVTAAYPEPTIRPRGAEDVAEAEKLTSILPVVLEQNEFRRTWSAVNKYKLKQGTGVYGVFWDGNKLNGIGDIAIRKIDLLRIFWEPGINDIQHSRYVFLTDLVDIDLLEERYPEHAGKLGKGGALNVKKYLYDDNVDTTDKALVVDVYYKVQRDGKMVLHYCKYSGQCVLYATENDTAPPASEETVTMLDGTPQVRRVPTGEPSAAERGLYDHGLYPFVVDALFEVEGTVAGYGYIDIGKSMQTQIDLMDQAFVKSTLANCTPRYLYKGNANINEEEFADFTKPFVRVEGSLDETNIREIPRTSLSGNFLNVYQMKVNELKEVLGNRDVANGGTTSGVTAASAIATLQEVSGRMSKDSTRDAYDAFKKIVNLCIELIRQFYTVPRTFRIMGENGKDVFLSYSNSGIGAQGQDVMGADMGLRLPVFDIEVGAQNATEYTKQSQNEMALQFFGLGFFNPQFSDQALACLETMDFEHKNELMDRIRMNGTLLQRLQQMQQIAVGLAQKYEPQLAQQLMMMSGGQPMPQMHGSVSGGTVGGEHAFVRKARAKADGAAQPGGV